MQNNTLERVEALSPSEPIFLDTETISLYGPTRLVQVRQGDFHVELDCNHYPISLIKQTLKNKWLVIHNALYDLTTPDFLKWLPTRVDDTLLLAKAVWPELPSYSLKYLAENILLSYKTDEGSSDWGTHLTPQQLEYAARDTLLLQQLWPLVESGVKDKGYFTLRCKMMDKIRGLSANIIIDYLSLESFVKDLKHQLTLQFDINNHYDVCNILNIKFSHSSYLLSLHNPLAQQIVKERELLAELNMLETILRTRPTTFADVREYYDTLLKGKIYSFIKVDKNSIF